MHINNFLRIKMILVKPMYSSKMKWRSLYEVMGEMREYKEVFDRAVSLTF
jgi:hypothetical protein